MNLLQKLCAASAALAMGVVIGGQSATAQTAPVGNAAYPSFGSCKPGDISGLPAQWSANALLTPFQSQPLQVVRVSGASGPGVENQMVVTVDDVNGGGLGSNS